MSLWIANALALLAVVLATVFLLRRWFVRPAQGAKNNCSSCQACSGCGAANKPASPLGPDL